MSVLWRLRNPKLRRQRWREAGACSEVQGRVISALMCLGGEEGTVGETVSFAVWFFRRRKCA